MDEVLQLCIAIQLRHWPRGRLWVDFPQPGGACCRLYHDGSTEWFRAG